MEKKTSLPKAGKPLYVAASYMTYKALPLTDLMKGFVTQPLGTCAERDAKIRAAWIGR